MAARTPKTVAAYLSGLPDEVRPTLEAVRAAILKGAPGAEEVISYQIPMVRLNGRVGIYFAAWKDYVSIYPITKAIEDELGEEIEPYRAQRATLRFPLSKKPPLGLITRIARVRVKESAALATKKIKPKSKRAPK